ncbi:hypothetical protein [Deinococcus sp. DB0503]|uniref:hypothetical protein n=1 Tax=Deinococcus sp. DB0503 TaxID=2479203 RepID=UPI0018E05F9B|nr:hypothetical protein [Deinococcus sp. DB0503]MBI0446872.1 hypothetical protein [Deinococcus sp. DB0503]
MRIYAAPARLCSGVRGPPLVEFGQLCLEAGFTPGRDPEPGETPQNFIEQALLAPLRRLKLPGHFGIYAEQEDLIAYVNLDDEVHETVSLAEAARAWGHTFVAGLLPYLHAVTRPVMPVMSPFDAGDHLLGMYGNYTMPGEHQGIVENLAEWYGVESENPDVDALQTALEAQGRPTPRTLLREFGPFLTVPATLEQLAAQAAELPERALAVVWRLRQAEEVAARLHPVSSEEWPDSMSAPYSLDGEDPVVVLLTTTPAGSEDVGWVEHAFHSLQQQMNEGGVRPLHAWDLHRPEHRLAAAYLRHAPELARHVRAILADLSGA